MSFLRHVPLVSLALGSLMACSAGVGTLSPGGGSGGKGPTAGGSGLGGGLAAGGSIGPGAGGAVVGTSGGAVGAGGGLTGSGGAVGAGGALVGAGGAAVGAGGAVVGAGGGSTGPGCKATAFTVANGYADNGTFCGYGWTAKNNKALAVETVDPPCGDTGPCFEDQTTLCADISLDAIDDTAASPVYTGAMIGWSVAEAISGGSKGTFTGTFTSITPTFTSGLTGEVRLSLQTAGGKEYCAPNLKSGTAVPVSGFKEKCWLTDATAIPAGTAIEAIALQVQGSSVAQAGKLCLTGLTVAK